MSPAEAQGVIQPRDRITALSDEQLLDALDLARPGLEAAAKHHVRGESAEALSAVAEYFRQRKAPEFPTHGVANAIRIPDLPQRYLNGERYVVGIWHQFPAGGVDYFFDATADRPDVPQSREWTWQLNRVYHWAVWAKAYREGDDPSYARAWAQELRAWRDQAPVDDARTPQGLKAWRTIEAGGRLRSSPRVFDSFRAEPALRDADVIEYLHFVRDHADYLYSQSARRGRYANWEAIEASGLFLASHLFPEFRRSKDWARHALHTFEKIAEASFYPDGAQNELTFGYGAATIGDCLFPFEVDPDLARGDGPVEVDAYLATLSRAVDWLVLCSGPDGWAPWFNDKELHTLWRLEAFSKALPTTPLWEYLLSDRSGPAPDGPTSAAFDWAGHYAMRSSWDADAHLLVFDAGPLGTTHQHQDKLNLVLWSHGQRILFDNGGGPYQFDQWREWALDSYSHNVALVDGLAQRRNRRDPLHKVSFAPINAGWVSNERYDFAEGVYDDGWGNTPLVKFHEDPEAFADLTYRPATHRRQVLFVKPDLYLVADELVSLDDEPHHFELRWHLLAADTRPQATDTGVVTANADHGNLQLLPLIDRHLETRVAVAEAGDGGSASLLGWQFNTDATRKVSGTPVEPAMTVVHRTPGPVAQQRWITALVPTPAGGSAPARITARHADGATLTLGDGRRFAVTWPGDRLRVEPFDVQGSALPVIQP
jgi:hypothetical protein